jgi:hypothetical protein
MRYFFSAVISVITILVLWVNIRLYSENYSSAEKRSDIICQLNFLEEELKSQNLGLRMQQIFPEGFVFINALYGLSWCELAMAVENDSFLKSKAVSESIFAYNQIDSENGKRIFNSDLKPAYGIFYSGWKNYLLSKILIVNKSFSGSEAYIDSFHSNCKNISKALAVSQIPFLESYPFQAWPADMFPAMASLSNHDKIFPPEFTYQISAWLGLLKTHIDPATGMIPHEADSKTGLTREGARGSSASLIIRLLSEINPLLARNQFQLFKDNFVSSMFGLPFVREYPKGISHSGDIDSGPVIFGIGFAATISSIGTFAVSNEIQSSENQYKTVNAFGFEFQTADQKKYLMGMLPMADAFIAWGRASALKYSAEYPDGLWRILFNVISFLLLSLLWFVWFRILKRR